ncbi:MAG TPA: outer membrane protein assembly factor BamD [Thermodesulfovibrionales bacterium]|nr:outer membrane protein assembly factor BamD [Thermodesulfovibrionales bacterium]
MERYSRIPQRPARLLCFPVLFLLLTLTVSCSSKKEVRPEGEFNAEKSFAMANDLIEKKEFENARKLLVEVKNRDLTKTYAPLAQLKIADSYAKEEENDLAVEEYRRFLDIYPDERNASYAQYQIAMIYFSQIESPERGFGAAAKALEEFEKLKRLFPRNPYKDIVELRIEKCRNTIADYEFLVGEFYFKKGAYNAALNRFKGLLSKYPDYKKEAVVLYHLGLCFKGIGERDKALEYLNLLVGKYPNDPLVKNATKEIASLAK